MKTATVACLTLFLTLLPSCTPAAKEEAKAVVTHVTADLRDGSRVVGVFAGKTLALDSASVGELQMPVERIRILEWPSEKKPAQLQAANGDKFAVELRLTELPITSSFGEIKVPVGKIRQLRFWTDAGGTNRVPGLVALWSGEGDARDSVSGQTAMVSGGVSYVPGKVGQSFSFDGTGSLSCGNALGNFGMNEFTLEFWLKTSTKSIMQILGKRTVCGATDFWGIGLGGGSSADGKVVLWVSNGEGINTDVLGNRAIDDGAFHQVAVTRQGILYQIYVDGVLDASSSANGIINFINHASLLAGTGPCVHQDGSQHFKGLLDELSFYSRALSADEIRQLFDAGNTETH